MLERKSTVTMILILAGLVVATFGAYAFARLLNPGLFKPSPTFSTTYDQAGISIPFPVSQTKIVAKLLGRIHSFAVSPDMKTIAIATSKGVFLYDLQSYEQLHILNSLEWLADGTLVSLETGYAERELTIIRFWDIDTGEILMKFLGASGTFGE
jgi:WD40 repeat protein